MHVYTVFHMIADELVSSLQPSTHIGLASTAMEDMRGDLDELNGLVNAGQEKSPDATRAALFVAIDAIKFMMTFG